MSSRMRRGASRVSIVRHSRPLPTAKNVYPAAVRTASSTMRFAGTSSTPRTIFVDLPPVTLFTSACTCCKSWSLSDDAGLRLAIMAQRRRCRGEGLPDLVCDIGAATCIAAAARCLELARKLAEAHRAEVAGGADDVVRLASRCGEIIRRHDGDDTLDAGRQRAEEAIDQPGEGLGADSRLQRFELLELDALRLRIANLGEARRDRPVAPVRLRRAREHRCVVGKL